MPKQKNFSFCIGIQKYNIFERKKFFSENTAQPTCPHWAQKSIFIHKNKNVTEFQYLNTDLQYFI